MKLLLENSADVNAKTKYNRTALMLAARYGHEKIVKILLEKSADVNAMVIPILTPKIQFYPYYILTKYADLPPLH